MGFVPALGGNVERRLPFESYTAVLIMAFRKVVTLIRAFTVPTFFKIALKEYPSKESALRFPSSSVSISDQPLSVYRAEDAQP